ncbi:hypothetical protein HYPSUDRAFT_892444 [Hypholoma sublateritium FD-334 SS-4]|uniref:Uncharacterized protein n=1 Tax=Hypholoma sublateritium (strain FD-334 SS-4) TaxID=945553 RepID=A0A0D2PHG9_HYPSF|nr:hypothetical protein HYPSUDRAFT_892444 [Hypholoma sublateritium FD-334 SS-4]
MSSPEVIHQRLYRSHGSEIMVQSCHPNQLHNLLPPFTTSVDNNVVGLAAVYGPKARLKKLAIASQTRVLIIDMNQFNKHNKNLLTAILCNPAYDKYAFEMDRLSTSLFLDSGLYIASAKDLLELSDREGKCDRHSLGARMFALGGEKILSSANAVNKCFLNDDTSRATMEVLALQSWAAGHAAGLSHMSELLKHISPINTMLVDKPVSSSTFTLFGFL